MSRGDAYVLATALYADRNESIEAHSDTLYHTVNSLGYSDEAKADLYAQLQESKLTFDTPFKQAKEVIEHCLNKTKARYG